MTTLSELTHPGGYLFWDAFRHDTRETITIAAGSFALGKVLGKITASGRHATHDPDVVHGAAIFGPTHDWRA